MKWLIFSILIIPSLSLASVWDDHNQWSLEFENKYNRWIESDYVQRDIFSNPESPYYGIITDCADAVYSLRMIFSFENKLPFAIKNPFGGTKSTITNKTNNFDTIRNPHQRVIAFANYLRNIIGTTSLAYNDTFPVLIKDLSPGDAYVTRYEGNGRSYQHAYIIKSLTLTGNFILYSSTVPARVRTFARDEGMPYPLFPRKPFGFRRFRWPKYLSVPASQIPIANGYSDEQYILRSQYSSSQFFSHIKDILKVNNPTVQGEIHRMFRNIESKLEQRADVIYDTEEYKKQIGNRCFSAYEYDLHSTPSRDSKIMKEISNLIDFWKQAKDEQRTSFVKKKVVKALDYLAEESFTRWGKCKLKRTAKLKIKTREHRKPKFTNLHDFYFGYKEGAISSHPNDTYKARWGASNETRRTTCPDYSGRQEETTTETSSPQVFKNLCSLNLNNSEKAAWASKIFSKKEGRLEKLSIHSKKQEVTFIKRSPTGHLESRLYKRNGFTLPIFVSESYKLIENKKNLHLKLIDEDYREEESFYHFNGQEFYVKRVNNNIEQIRAYAEGQTVDCLAFDQGLKCNCN